MKFKCEICGRKLKAEKSVSDGVGPECASKFASRVASCGSSPARLDALDALGDAEVSRWTRVARRAAGRGCLRDARMFIDRAEREAAAVAPAVIEATPAAPAAPAPAPPVSQEIVIRRDDRGWFMFCPPWKDPYFISDFKRRVGRPFRAWNDRANQWEVTPVETRWPPMSRTSCAATSRTIA